MPDGPALTFILPAYNEEANVGIVLDEVLRVSREMATTFEIVAINDGSTDTTGAILQSYARRPGLRMMVIDHTRPNGAHASELEGMRVASGAIFVFLPTDRQVMPDTVYRLLPALRAHDVVFGRRRRRADPLPRLLLSRVYNGIIRSLLPIPIHDLNCCIAIRKEVFDAVGQLMGADSAFVHAELVVLSAAAGFRVTEVDVEHFPRVAGRAKGVNLVEFTHIPGDLIRFARKIRRLSRQASLQGAAGMDNGGH